LVGASLAAVGAQVLLTDLPTLVENAIIPNLELNQNVDQEEDEATSASDSPGVSEWLNELENENRPVSIGKGWAGTAALDWTKPVEEQLSPSGLYENVDLIVASDCVWLVSMLNALLDTVEAIFAAAATTKSSKSDTKGEYSGPTFVMSFQRRDTPTSNGQSSIFTTVERVVDAMKGRGWNVDCLAWHPVKLDGDQPDQEVYLFEIVPKQQGS